MKNPKIRALKYCSMLKNLLIIVRIANPKESTDIRNTINYFMERSNISSEELTEYQLSRSI